MEHSQYPTPPPSASHFFEEKQYDPIAAAAMSYYDPRPDEAFYPAAAAASYPLPQSRPQTPQQQQPLQYTQRQDRIESSRYPTYNVVEPQRRPDKRSSPRSPRPATPSFTHRVPSPYTPYNVSRPAPRKGLVRRTWAKLKSLLHALGDFVRAHPVAFGLASLLPIVAGAGAYKAITALTGLWTLREETRRGRVDEDKADEGAPRTSPIWALGSFLLGGSEFRTWWFDEFKGFNGTKYGPLEGVLKLLQMFVNHWCKLTPSGIPRTMSILLEVYFLDAMGKNERML